MLTRPKHPVQILKLFLAIRWLMRDLLPGLPRLRWVQSAYAGVESLLDPSLRHDYVLTNARGVFGGLMSEYVFGYLLNHERRIFERYQAQQEHRWDGSNTGVLRGKTIGLLGVGSIGAHLARTAKYFEIKRARLYAYPASHAARLIFIFTATACLVLPRGWIISSAFYPTHPRRVTLWMPRYSRRCRRTRFLSTWDAAARWMKSALIRALTMKKIAAAVLDVFEQEPLPKEHPFWNTPNLLITFHTSAPSLPEDIAKLFIENYHRFVNNEELMYRVDFRAGTKRETHD